MFGNPFFDRNKTEDASNDKFYISKLLLAVYVKDTFRSLIEREKIYESGI